MRALIVVVGVLIFSSAAVYWWTNWVPQITVVVQVGAVVSLLLALYQLGQVGKTDRSLREISESMSTKYVGEFPDHVPEITRLIGTANKKVTIVCDLLGYGYYSSPHQYQRYRAAILGLNSGVEATIAIYGKERACQAAKEQLGDSFEDIVKSDSYKNYVSYYNIGKDEEPKDTHEFYEKWKSDYETQCADFNVRHVVIREVTNKNKTIPVYFWIIDDRSAIFSFPSLSIDPPEVAFKTSDRDLINIFKRILTDLESST